MTALALYGLFAYAMVALLLILAARASAGRD